MNVTASKRLLRFLFASSIGTYLEFFDLALYSFCAPIISQNFFPVGDEFVATLATWALFAISYLMRPLGALWFGHMADVHSSRRAMVVSMALMALATCGIGLLPTYATIGLWAPILLLLLRIIQSIAVSPEYNLASVFIKNNSWFAQRFGLASSISASVTGLGMLSASCLMGQILAGAQLLSIADYKWRLPFIVAGLLVGTIGIYLRWNIDEKLITRSATSPIKAVFKQQSQDFFIATFIAGYIGCITYVLFSYLIYVMQTIKHLAPGESLQVLNYGILILPGFSLLSGYMSDKITRSLLMLSGASVIAISGYVLFNQLPSADLPNIQIYTCCMLAGLGFFAGSFPGYLAELFAPEYRYTGSFLAYNIGMSWLGGISPLLLISLSKISYSLPIVAIILYSLLVIILLVRKLYIYSVKQASMLY